MGKPDRQEGFSLIELVVASAVFALVMISALTLFATNQGLFNSGKGKAEVHQNARVSIESVGREIRMAGYDPENMLESLSSPTGIQVAAANSLTLIADLTGDGVTDRVTYGMTGSTVTRQLSSWDGAAFQDVASSVIADGVGVLAFTYFDADDLPITAPVAAASLGDIRRVGIGLVANESIVGEQESFALALDVKVRN